MANIDVGVRVNDQGAKQSLEELDREIKKIIKDSKKASENTKKFGDETDKTGDKAKNSAKSLSLASIGYMAIFASVVKATKSLFDFIGASDEVGKASQRMGVSIEFYQKMVSASEHAGTSVATMNTAMRTLTKAGLDATKGLKTQTDAFNDIGVSVKNSSGELKTQETLLTETLTALSNMSNETERNAIAQQLLGRSASALNPLLNEGADAIHNYIVANDGAVVVSQRLADASARVDDTMQTIAETIRQQVSTSLTSFVELMGNVLGTFDDDTIIRFGQSVGLVFKGVIKVGVLFWGAIERIFNNINTVINGTIVGVFSLVSGLQEAVITTLKIASALEEASNALVPKNMETHMWAGKIEEMKKSQEFFDNAAQSAADVMLKEKDAGNERDRLRKNWILGIDAETEAIKKNTKAKRINATPVGSVGGGITGSGTTATPSATGSTGGTAVYRVKTSFTDIYDMTSAVTGGITNLWSGVADSMANSAMSGANAWKTAEQHRLSSSIITSRRRNIEQAKIDKEMATRQEEAQKAQKEAQIAGVWGNTAMGIAGLWGNAFATEAPPLALATAIGMTPLLLGMAGVQTANIAKYADGGIIGGSDYSSDRRPAMVNSGEMIFNKRQQQNLLEIASGNNGGGGISLHIENLHGSDEDVSRLHDMLIELRSNGQINDTIFA